MKEEISNGGCVREQTHGGGGYSERARGIEPPGGPQAVTYFLLSGTDDFERGRGRMRHERVGRFISDGRVRETQRADRGRGEGRGERGKAVGGIPTQNGGQTTDWNSTRGAEGVLNTNFIM